MPLDIQPATEDSDTSAVNDSEYTCEVCQAPLTYNGRGRKPTKCSPRNGGREECYSTRGATLSQPREKSNDKLARQAANVLTGMNAGLGTGAYLLGLRGTAAAIRDANESFDPAAYEALKMDPGMCRMILRGGANSGKVMLAIAYLMLGMNVAPIAVTEYRMIVERAKERRAEQS